MQLEKRDKTKKRSPTRGFNNDGARGRIAAAHAEGIKPHQCGAATTSGIENSVAAGTSKIDSTGGSTAHAASIHDALATFS